MCGTCGAKITKHRVLEHINSTDSMQANFTEIKTDFSKSYGTILLSKDGRTKICYEHPRKITIIKNNGIILHYDHELDELSQFKNKDNLLESLLSNKLNADSEITCQDQNCVVTITDGSERSIAITLISTEKDELEVKSINIIDGDLQSIMEFKNLKRNIKLNPNMFYFERDHNKLFDY
ncbi:Outer-membrane lipoprotein carrier protein [Candidatus Cyrtobacter comes]|uniref:Outer-membrane lipoprotein carrier protein n=1 Tax=Candidatus Cyrtobacter comes TaxID=675776 RepID=A0ABU5L734_9RICK|nr:outer membrane lipoprotein carrier protein LolA [Candidatus Cyrtobacter comes]MDZ5761933.1 Outer-membrane lipoprotein carrier protein [Candidatus Cyrtobacter comes]